MEKRFLELMLEQMERTALPAPDGPGDDFHRSLIRERRAEVMSRHRGGMGVQDLILDQLHPRKAAPKEEKP